MSYQATALDDRDPGGLADACAIGRAPRTARIAVADTPAEGYPARAGRAPLVDGDPRRVGRYRLTARLGAGGMGVVYLGVGEDGRLVAVKVPRPGLADDPDFLARFGREVAVLSRVRGARVMRVVEAGTDARGPFLVTEYAAGPSLAGYVEMSGPLGAGMLDGLATGLAEALTAIHAAGVVHRDLKPSNVIMTTDGPKVIDFGIAQALDSVALTRVGVTVGSAGFMAPEQFMGHVGPAADIFAWALTVAYAASGQPPFGTGPTAAIMYRILNAQPDIAAVPPSLRPVVEAALAKRPQDRPAAHEIVDQLTAPAPAPARPGPPRALAWTWPSTGCTASQPEQDQDRQPVPVEPAAPGTWRPRAARRLSSGRTAAAAVLALVVMVASALALLAGRGPGAAQLASGQRGSSPPPAAGPFGTYPGQQGRGVFATISRIVAYGTTIVTTGEQTSGGVVRQQFFTSADGGESWHLAPVHAPGGGQPPLGYPATRLAGGPAGWVATGPQATWTSTDGLSWTLAATHGITPQLPGDQVWVLTSTADGFLAAGQAQAPGGTTQAVIWTSRDGLTWQRMTATRLGLAGPGYRVLNISYAASHGEDTVISGALSDGRSAAWLSTDGGSTWTQVNVPADHGASAVISGLGSDGSGLIAVRPGPADGIAYFSPNGQTWQYAATIGAAGGFSPGVVKGSDYGFVVTGTNAAGDDLAYASTDTGTAWRPTGSLGTTASGASVLSATLAPGEVVIAAGSTARARTGQQAVLLAATTAGAVRPVPLAGLPGAVLPQVAVNALASAGGQQIAVGSADGYPAIWRKAAGGSWTLVSPLSLVSSSPGALTSVTHGPDGWLAVGAPGPVVLTSANGTTWQPAAGSIARGLAGAAAVAATAGPAGYAIVGKLVAPGGNCVADVWWSPDLAHWTRAHDVNDATGSSQVLAVAADPHGFISAGSHDGRPALWTTTSGPAWTTIVLPLPAGATSGVLQQIAISGNRVVALGQQVMAGVTMPLAELSVDGGATFTPVPFSPPGPDPAATALTAGAGGFTAAYQSGPPGQQDVTIWTSPDGTTWTPSPVSGLSGSGTNELTALAATGATVTAIGSAATQQGQQLAIVTLPAR